ncbi:MAG: class II fructose-bisphosphatase, partial [Chloroflexota bacterium]|nr:class II fructose-bisphosphatase [Chloroflexota bacterium]
MTEAISPNLGLDLLRVTETAALAAGRWMGRGNAVISNRKAARAMTEALNTLNIDGYIVIGEEGRTGESSPLNSGKSVGNGDGPEMDVVVDPIDGTDFLIMGQPDAVSVAGIAPRNSMWAPAPAVYMDKIVVGAEAAESLVPECLDAPAAWTLALVARVKGKSVRDLVVFVLDRPRHKDLIEEIRSTGARVTARSHGDVAGALMAASKDINVDILMGIGGIAEGVISACAVKSLSGAMLGRIAPQSAEERAAVKNANLDENEILTCDEIVTGQNIYFTATGITDGILLSGVNYRGDFAETESIIIRCETGTRRIVHTEHLVKDV